MKTAVQNPSLSDFYATRRNQDPHVENERVSVRLSPVFVDDASFFSS